MRPGITRAIYTTAIMTTTSDIDQLDIERYLSLYPDNITKHLSIIKYSDIGHELYHISTKRQRELVPNISRRSSYKENNTIPRVHTAPYLLGCMASVANIAYKAIYTDTAESKEYKGGWYIHAVDYDIALKPDTTLVFDVNQTDETWLVAYNETISTYPTRVIGKFIPTLIEYTPVYRKPHIETIQIALNITDKNGAWLTKDTYVAPGYYSVVVSRQGIKYKLIDHKVVEQQEWAQVKKLQADMLSYDTDRSCWSW